MKLSKETFYDKVFGCWMGKNIGGTLGMPVEWMRQKNNFTFYSQDLSEPAPNDDLDLQLIWLLCAEERGIKLTSKDLAEYWLNYQVANYSEYGVAKANLKAGFLPPLSGTIGNEYKDSCGAYIRSEIWACMCPGRPDLAAQYCYEDAIVDHGNGEGTYAALFAGAMEAAAFVESDLRKLIEIGLSYIPEDCGTAAAIKTAIECYDGGKTWEECRDTILERHRGSVFFKRMFVCAKEDQEKGFHKGKVGYDVPSNIGFVVAGMLYGEGDFDKCMCITVNMGEDTDCTAGTVGAIFGIIYGYKNIPQKWVEPIGHGIKSICCSVAHGPFFPTTIENLTDRTIKLTKQVSLYYKDKDEMDTMDVFGDTDDLSDVKKDKLYFQNTWAYPRREVLMSMNGPRFDSYLFSAALDYEQTYLEPGGEANITLKIAPNEWIEPNNLIVEWISDDLDVQPQTKICIPMWQRYFRYVEKVKFTVSSEFTEPIYHATIKISIPGRPTSMFIPVTLTSWNRPEDPYFEG